MLHFNVISVINDAFTSLTGDLVAWYFTRTSNTLSQN